jgi:3-phenylpropionate/cinnamic acid dioxygenase small subunit
MQAMRDAARLVVLDCAMALDDGDFARWPGFFTDDATYRITTRSNEAAGHPWSLMWCDGQAGLWDRVEALERANHYEPHHYCHILSDTQVTAVTPSRLAGRTNFLVMRTMQDGATLPFLSGHYRDEVVRDGERVLLRERVVVLDQARIDTLLAIPV